MQETVSARKLKYLITKQFLASVDISDITFVFQPVRKVLKIFVKKYAIHF